MKKLFTLRRSIAAILFTASLTASNLFAALVELSPSESAISLGGTFALDLSISGLVDDDLGAFELQLSYDPDVLEFVDFIPGWQLGTGVDAIIDYDIVAPGIVDIAMTSMLQDLSGQSEFFSLGGVRFKGIGIGICQIALSTMSLSNGDGTAFIPATAGPAASASVPEPPLMPMLAVSMLGIVLWRRRPRTN